MRVNRLRVPVLVLLVALVAAACGSTGPTSGPSSPAGPGASSTAGASGGPSSATPSETASGEPASAPPTASQAPTDNPTPGASSEPGASEVPTAADACTGNGSIHDFFASVARAVDWTVYCAVLPAGWYVDTGSYRLANGGKVVIGYKGPDGATFALSEGAFCQDAGGCVPSGTDSGDASFGALAGTLVDLDDGGWAVVVDRGAPISWLLVTHGLDQATTVSLAAALYEVAG